MKTVVTRYATEGKAASEAGAFGGLGTGLAAAGTAAAGKQKENEIKGLKGHLSSLGSHAKNVASDIGNSLTMGMGLGKTAAFGLGGAIIGSTLAAEHYNMALAQLKTAQRAANESMSTAQLEAINTKMEGYGITDTNTAKNLATLAESHIPVNQQMAVMQAAMDLSAASGKPLAETLKAVSLAAMGGGRALKQYGIELPPAGATTKQLAADQAALKVAQQKLTEAQHGGAGASAGSTSASIRLADAERRLNADMSGHSATARQLVSDQLAVAKAHESMGLAADKYAASSAKRLQAAQDAVTKAHEKVAIAAYQVTHPFANLAVATKAVEDRFKGQAAAAADNEPLKVLGASLEGIGQKAGQTLIPILDRFSHWIVANKETIKAVLVVTMNAVATALTVVGNVVGFVAGHFDIFGPILAGIVALFLALQIQAAITAITLIAVSAPFILIGAAVVVLALLIATHFNQIKKFVGDVVKGMVDLFTHLPGKIIGALIGLPGMIWNSVLKPIVGFIGDMFGQAGSFVAGIGKGLLDVVLRGLSGMINWIIDRLNSIKLDLGPIHWGGFGLKHIDLHMAEGGIVTKPTNALIGEAGPEAVIPLSKMGSLGGGTIIHLHMEGSTLMSDRDMDVFIEKMGSRIARFTGPASGLSIKRG